MSDPWILCVDDDERVLDGLELVLSSQHHVVLATNGREALEKLSQRAGCGVVISDMRMPGMNGAQLLAEVRRIEPDASRMLLTGFSELNDAATAVNEGRIFRLLIKPCPGDQLLRAVADGFEHHRLRANERQLLEHTLNGTVQLLVDVLSIAAPAAFERAALVRQLVLHSAGRLGWEPSWELEIAAQLARLGWIALPGDVVERHLAGQSLTDTQHQLVASAPAQAARLLDRVPRLETVANLLVEHAAVDQGSEPTPNALLRAALDVDLLIAQGTGMAAALRQLSGRHDRRLLQSMAGFRFERHPVPATLTIEELTPGMVTDEDLTTTAGKTLIRAATELTSVHIQRICNFHATVGVKEPVRMLVSARPSARS